tara:strand:- start:68 stop:775 length:708 start_codon:yes stop_codon:yes gene_type:complete
MAVLSKGNTYTSGDAVTAANLNTLVDSATFVTGSNQSTDDTTLEVHSSGYLKIKDGGVDETQLANGAVTPAKLDASFEVTSGEIADNAVTLAKMEHGTAGDVISYNASAEPIRVSLGAASSYLRVNAAATAVEWSSSDTLQAKCSFESNGTLNAGGNVNVSTVVRNSTGNYTVTFTSSVTNPIVQATISSTGDIITGAEKEGKVVVSNLSTTGCIIKTGRGSYLDVDCPVHLLIF